MGLWSPSMFSDDMALDIRREYSILLSVCKSSEEAEKMMLEYYSSIMNCGDPDEDVFWFVLALCEWKKGRLSPFVKEKALQALSSGRDLELWRAAGDKKNYEKRKKVLKELEETILSPMPPAKKIRKPTVHHCPWKVGSLLAYRIISCKDKLINSPCYTKYVLLRVVRVEKRPISRMFDTGYYDESMLVGLYNWIGSEIPDPETVQKLEYIPIEKNNPLKPVRDIDLSTLETLSEKSKSKVTVALESYFQGTEEKCVWLDWLPTKYEQGDITFLSCDEDFQSNIPEFFGLTPSSRIYTHFLPFDLTLSRIFDPCFEDSK